jgi:ubiquinone/menaquinone biosynthesis C-methylase UbiE
MSHETLAPNHHKDFPAFAGALGLLAALSMTVRRGGDARLAVGLTGAGPGDTVVDVGCGPGAAARHAARAGATVIGVDPARVMRRVAGVLTAGRRRGIRYMDGTAEALPVGDGAATVLWSIATVHHWDDIDGGLAEARRVLAPGGRLLAVERRTQPGARGHRSHGWTDAQAEAFAARCRAQGFEDVRVEQRTGGRGPVLAVLGAAPVIN